MLRYASILTLLACATAAHAQNVPDKQISGKTVAKRIDQLSQLDWKRDWKLVKQMAHESKRLAIWLQVVGELDGGL